VVEAFDGVQRHHSGGHNNEKDGGYGEYLKSILLQSKINIHRSPIIYQINGRSLSVNNKQIMEII